MTDPNITLITATIASGSSLSNSVDMTAFSINKDNRRAFGIITPSALTGTTLTFLASVDGTTFNPIYDIYGAAITVNVGINRYIPLDPAMFAAIPYLKVSSGSTEAGSRSITIVSRVV